MAPRSSVVLLSLLVPTLAKRFHSTQQGMQEEMATLGLEGQDESERMKCIVEKVERPSGLLESHAGKKFPTKIQVDSLNNTAKLKDGVCEPDGCGLLDMKNPRPLEGKPCLREVPKLIQFVWLDHPMPEKYAKNVANVMKVNSDRAIMIWVNEVGKDISTLSALLDDSEKERLHVKSVEEYSGQFRNWDIIEKEPNVGARSDWIRLEGINLFGGIYMDTDSHPVQSFSDYGGVFRWPFVAYSDPQGYGNLCNCVFGAEKQSSLINLTIEGWRDTFFNNAMGSGALGCPMLTTAFKTQNDPEILMLAEWYMFKAKDGIDPIMTEGFDGSWLDGKFGYATGF